MAPYFPPARTHLEIHVVVCADEKALVLHPPLEADKDELARLRLQEGLRVDWLKLSGGWGKEKTMRMEMAHSSRSAVRHFASFHPGRPFCGQQATSRQRTDMAASTMREAPAGIESYRVESR